MVPCSRTTTLERHVGPCSQVRQAGMRLVVTFGDAGGVWCVVSLRLAGPWQLQGRGALRRAQGGLHCSVTDRSLVPLKAGLLKVLTVTQAQAGREMYRCRRCLLTNR